MHTTTCLYVTEYLQHSFDCYYDRGWFQFPAIFNTSHLFCKVRDARVFPLMCLTKLSSVAAHIAKASRNLDFFLTIEHDLTYFAHQSRSISGRPCCKGKRGIRYLHTQIHRSAILSDAIQLHRLLHTSVAIYVATFRSVPSHSILSFQLRLSLVSIVT